MSPKWNTLGTVAPSKLVDTRLQLHWAAQVPAALGVRHAEPAEDWSHMSLSWDAGHGALLSHATACAAGLRAGLAIARFELLLLDAEDNQIDTFALEGQTLSAAQAWLSELFNACNDAGEGTLLALPEHELPAHPVGSGEPFGGLPAGALERTAASAELAHWFANAATVLERVARREVGASPVRVWPHHFDCATLITLDPELDSEKVDSEKARSIGVGFSPGDGSYAEPYFYVTPWPYPHADQYPELAGGGQWHTEGWVGAVLTATALTGNDSGSSAEQEARVMAFVESALAAARELLGDPA